MRLATLPVADHVYECAAGSAVGRHRLTHREFGTLCLSLTRLIRGLGDAARDEVWKSILAPLRRYRFALCAAPLPFNEPSVQTAHLGWLRARCEALTMVYPSPALQLQALLDTLERLVQSSENPYGSWLTAAARRLPGSGAVLVRDSRLIHPTERFLATDPGTRPLVVITPAQLSRDRCFDVLYVLGAGRWFPPFVFSAPRAKRVELVRYAWVKDRPEPPKTLLASVLPEPESEDESLPEDAYCDAGDLLPVIDWRAIGQRIAATEIENPLEAVDARLMLLEGDCAVFLEATEGASVLTIDLDADETTERIARLPTAEVRAGTFVLLRTSGGGDYIVAEADRHFLRDRAPNVREAQRRWKTHLRNEVERSSLLEVSIRLLDLGSSCGNELNVRNWLSARSIRTHDTRDFQAIMRLIGLGDSWEEYWLMMGEIDHAHRQAGLWIRRQLLRRLQQLDLTELERVGRMEFTLPDADAGSFTAFRVVEIAPETQLVPFNRLGHPFEV